MFCFLAAAVGFAGVARLEQPGFKKTIQSKSRGTWSQSAPAKCPTPQSFLFLVLALTGARLSEALKMRWADIDFSEGGRTSGCILIRAQKTGKKRWLPLVGAREGLLAPGLFEELKRLKLQAGNRQFVLPHTAPTNEKPNPVPVFVRSAWIEIGNNAAVDLRNLTPQALRQNLCSYLAAQGITAGVASDWLGHGERVAARFYRGQALRRLDGDSVEEAMGLNVFAKNSDTQAS